jgi:hypothetical protein
LDSTRTRLLGHQRRDCASTHETCPSHPHYGKKFSLLVRWSSSQALPAVSMVKAGHLHNCGNQLAKLVVRVPTLSLPLHLFLRNKPIS